MPSALHVGRRELQRIAKLIDDYLDERGWKPSDFCRCTGASPSSVSHARAARKPIGPAVAISIEKALEAEHTKGVTAVRPLRAIDLSPALARQAKKTRRLAA